MKRRWLTSAVIIHGAACAFALFAVGTMTAPMTAAPVRSEVLRASENSKTRSGLQPLPSLPEGFENFLAASEGQPRDSVSQTEHADQLEESTESTTRVSNTIAQ